MYIQENCWVASDWEQVSSESQRSKRYYVFKGEHRPEEQA